MEEFDLEYVVMALDKFVRVWVSLPDKEFVPENHLGYAQREFLEIYNHHHGTMEEFFKAKSAWDVWDEKLKANPSPGAHQLQRYAGISKSKLEGVEWRIMYRLQKIEELTEKYDADRIIDE